MDLFTYLMAKNGHNTSIHEDLFSYLLGKAQGGGGEIKTATGITINIPDAKKLVSFMMTKESTQDGEPSPDYPQEVKTVKGYRNEYDFINGNYSGDNNATITRENGTYIVNAPNLYANARFNQSNLQLKPNTTYTFYAKIINTTAINGSRVYVSDGLSTIGQIWGNKVFANGISLVKFTTPNTISNTAWIGLYPSEGNTTATFTDVMLVEGDQELPYVPYGNNYINTKVVGKNLFPGWEEGAINTSTGEPYEYQNRYRSKDYIEIQPNTNYYFSNTQLVSGTAYWFVIYKYDKNKNYLGYQHLKENDGYVYNGIININDNEMKYIKISEIALLTTFSNTQLELGTSRTDYEEYKETTTTIPLNNNEIVGIGDYKDELLVDKSGHVFINKKCGKITFNGSENDWAYQSDSRYPFRYVINNIRPFDNLVQETPNTILSNYFSPSYWTNTESNGKFTGMRDFPKRIAFANNSILSLNDWKTWLSTHNTKVYYPLATPELIDLQTTVDLSLFKGVNNVSNSVDGYMTIEYR